MGQWGGGRHRGGTTNGKTLMMEVQVLGPKLHKHFKMFHRKNGKGEDIGTFLFYSLKEQAFKAQSKLLFPIQKNYSGLENTVMLHCLFFLKVKVSYGSLFSFSWLNLIRIIVLMHTNLQDQEVNCNFSILLFIKKFPCGNCHWPVS